MTDQTPHAPDRAAFLAERRRVARDRYDRLFAPTYDEEWGEVSPSHAAMLGRLLAATVPGGEVLDAPCGTGKYWPAILASGRRVCGVDQSAGMLEQAAAGHPGVPARRMALQELDDRDRYDAVACIDGLENVGPEDWPDVLARLRRAAMPGAPIYLTVELFDPGDPESGGLDLAASAAAAQARGEPVVDGEDLNEDGGYHYFPGPARVLGWLAEAGIAVDETLQGDGYFHVLGHRPDDAPQTGRASATSGLPAAGGSD